MRMFSSGACARQSPRPAPSEVAGTRCRAHTCAIGTVPAIDTPMTGSSPVTASEARAARQDHRMIGRGPPGGLALARHDLDIGKPASIEVAPDRGNHLVRHLVGHDPDIEPGVRLGRGHRLGRGLGVTGPQALQVERGVEAHRLHCGGPVEPADKGLQLPLLADVDQVLEVHRRDRRQLRAGRWPLAGIQTFDRRPAGRIPERRECLHQSVTGIGQQHRQAGVGIVRERADEHLDHDHALAATHDLRPAFEIEAAALDQRGVGHAEVWSQVEQRIEGAAADLLLTLDEEPDPAGQRAERLEPGLDRPDPRQQLALVVGRSTRPHAPVPYRRLVGRTGPQLQGRRWLDVVVLDSGHGSGAFSDLADNQGRDAVQLEHVDSRAQTSQAGGRPVRGRAQMLSIPALRGDAQEVDQLVGPGTEAVGNDRRRSA